MLTASLTETFDRDAESYISEKFPGCHVTKSTISDCNAVTVTRSDILKYLLSHDRGSIYTDATYFIAPKRGHCVTVGVEIKSSSFIPIFSAVSQPKEHTEKHQRQKSFLLQFIFCSKGHALSQSREQKFKLMYNDQPQSIHCWDVRHFYGLTSSVTRDCTWQSHYQSAATECVEPSVDK